MTDIDFFMQGTVGIDMLNSNIKDIHCISKYIEENYYNCIPDSAFVYDEKYEKSLEGYFYYLKNDATENPWQVLVYEPEMKSFNGYRGESFKDFAYVYDVVTAAEIVADLNLLKEIKITENELSELLYG